ncbi:MAG: DUF1194 domain-containing protein [Rhodospirillales bacterium]|nr:DUF1194 domain-containing protein [Rhodospirillales bacterium]MDP6644148.1 DUF1194 domain-containing protein [Rhodospirillales bacterium]
MTSFAGRRPLWRRLPPGVVPAFVAIWMMAAPAHPAERVDLELVLATDTSRSIDESEARLQREGVAAALRHPDIIGAIQSGYHKKIAAAYIDYSSRNFNEIIVEWRIIDGLQSAAAFARALTETPLTFGRRTSISDGLEMAAQMIESNQYIGTRRVIDVAGDGPNNHGRLVNDVRDEIIAKGITINGLPIINDGNFGFARQFNIEDLDDYYRGCVIGGNAAFLVVARDFKDFARAIRRKLIFEIAQSGTGTEAKMQNLLHRIVQTGRPHGAYVYKRGCDIGERLWLRRFYDPDNY